MKLKETNYSQILQIFYIETFYFYVSKFINLFWWEVVFTFTLSGFSPLHQTSLAGFSRLDDLGRFFMVV